MKIEINENEQKSAIDCFVKLAGTSKQEATNLVKYALQAAVRDTCETIMGTSVVPTTLAIARVNLLKYVCLDMGRQLTPLEIQILFRTTPSNAKAIQIKMASTYAQSLFDQFLADMQQDAHVELTGSRATGNGYKVTFTKSAAYQTACDVLERSKLLNSVICKSQAREIDFPVEIGDVPGPKNAELLSRLGLTKP